MCIVLEDHSDIASRFLSI